MTSKKIFVYIHIPFCDSKCGYCRFTSIQNVQKNEIEKYINFLYKEIEDYKLDSWKKLVSIYFWWWTPSILEWIQIKKIINILKKKIKAIKNIEITLETTPKKITKENLILWKNIWINRLSIWIQTLNKKSLEKIGRNNTSSIINISLNNKIYWSIINNISVDFIIWLPYVKKWEIKDNIKFLLNKYNCIKHISVYMLEEYLYPKDWKILWINKKDYLWEYIEICNFLENKWFIKYEISNFALQWYECKHNKAYWNHQEILWFWLNAHSYINKIRYSNSDIFNNYYKYKWIFKEKLTSEDLFLEKIMFQLRTWWIKKELYNKLDKKNINFLINNWYLKIETLTMNNNTLLKLENKWVLILDYILKEII